MNPRTTGILFLVALALGAFVWLYEVRGGERRQAAEEAAKRLFPDLEQEDVRAIAFTTSDGKDVRLEFGEQGWAIVEPIAFPADESVLSGMAAALAQLAGETTLESPQAPEVYGLGGEAKSVRFRAKDAEHVVRFGKKTPVDYATYASLDDSPAVHTVPSYRANTFERTLDDLRERRVLRFDRESIERIEASWPGGGVALEKRGADWQLVSPLQAAADPQTVDDLLADLGFLRAEGFVDEPSAAVQAGLAEPSFRIALRGPQPAEGQPPLEHVLVVGGTLEGNRRAARGAGATVYALAQERVQDLPQRVADYRFRTLATFTASDAQRLEMVFHAREGEPLTVRAERREGGWTSEPEPIAAGKAARLVAELARLRADDILAESAGPAELAGLGLAPPHVVLRAFGGAPEGGGEAPLLGEVLLGRFDEAGIVAKAPGRDTIYRLSHDMAEHLPVSLEAFRNRFVSKEPPSPPAGGGAEPGVPGPEDALPPDDGAELDPEGGGE